MESLFHRWYNPMSVLLMQIINLGLIYKDLFLFSSKTGAIQDSFEYRFGLRRNARLNPGKFQHLLENNNEKNPYRHIASCPETRVSKVPITFRKWLIRFVQRDFVCLFGFVCVCGIWMTRCYWMTRWPGPLNDQVLLIWNQFAKWMHNL